MADAIVWPPPLRPFFEPSTRLRSAPGRTRTADAGLRTASLCPLSYGGANSIVTCRAAGRRCQMTPGGRWRPTRIVASPGPRSGRDRFLVKRPRAVV